MATTLPKATPGWKLAPFKKEAAVSTGPGSRAARVNV
jgi:hypothetical protein